MDERLEFRQEMKPNVLRVGVEIQNESGFTGRITNEPLVTMDHPSSAAALPSIHQLMRNDNPGDSL